MKLREGFSLRNICGENVVTASGMENINFNKLLKLNSSAVFLWESFYGKEFEVQDLANALVAQYGIDNALAAKDSEAMVNQWREAGILDE